MFTNNIYFAITINYELKISKMIFIQMPSAPTYQGAH